MLMFRIVGMRTGGRFGIEFQAGVIQFFKADAAGVVTHHRVFADEGEKGAAVSVGGRARAAISEDAQQCSLLIWCERGEGAAVYCGGTRIKPIETVSKGPLQLGVVRGHEVDELGDAGVARAGGFVFRDDDFAKLIDGGKLGGRKELRLIGLRPGRGGDVVVFYIVLGRADPARETREATGGSGECDQFENLSPVG